MFNITWICANDQDAAFYRYGRFHSACILRPGRAAGTALWRRLTGGRRTWLVAGNASDGGFFELTRAANSAWSHACCRQYEASRRHVRCSSSSLASVSPAIARPCVSLHRSRAEVGGAAFSRAHATRMCVLISEPAAPCDGGIARRGRGRACRRDGRHP